MEPYHNSETGVTIIGDRGVSTNQPSDVSQVEVVEVREYEVSVVSADGIRTVVAESRAPNVSSEYAQGNAQDDRTQTSSAHIYGVQVGRYEFSQEEIAAEAGPYEASSATTGPDAREHPHNDLSEQLLADYHRLLDKKFAKGLSTEDKFDLDKIERLLDAAEMSSPTEAATEARNQARYEQMTTTLENILQQLKALR